MCMPSKTLSDQRATHTGDEAGIARLVQRISPPNAFLYDTPAVLWPRIIVAKSGYNLADSGAIGRNGFHEEDAARAWKSRARVDDGSHIARFHRQSKPYAHTEWA